MSRGWCNNPAFVFAGAVVAQRQRQHNGQPENGADNYKLSPFGAVTRMHKVEDDERSLKGGYPKRNNNVEGAEILIGGPNGEARADHQCGEDHSVDFRRNNMFRHAKLSLRLLIVPVNQI